MSNRALLKAAGYGSIVFALKHASTARQFQNLRGFQDLPNIAYTCSTVGWYQGSAYLVLTGLLNLNWAQNPGTLNEPLNRAMAALLVLIAWSSSTWYLRRGQKASGILTAAAGMLQAWVAFH
ncbi:hypothetical protein N8T08_006117 [Aspergillus melleus]|uniref:Uncharacterized protein n=1 Tax=Aspergillus melleus TaxID=138277 RepID=A0ACC3B0U5_9EURO|nr:hypothetical protein N8T08_006117 [Aspergillus melleus]